MDIERVVKDQARLLNEAYDKLDRLKAELQFYKSGDERDRRKENALIKWLENRVIKLSYDKKELKKELKNKDYLKEEAYKAQDKYINELRAKVRELDKKYFTVSAKYAEVLKRFNKHLEVE